MAEGIAASTLRVHLRWMIVRDLPEVLAMEAASFDSAWTEADFRKVMRQRNTLGTVAVAYRASNPAPVFRGAPDEAVVGYLIYGLHRNYYELLNFAVDPRCRRRGIGRQLIEKFTGKLRPGLRRSVRLVVRDGNLPAQLFFRALGFRATGVLRGYYERLDEDGYRMEYRV